MQMDREPGSDWNVEAEVELLRETCRELRSQGLGGAEVAVVLGSGLAGFAERVEDVRRVALHEVSAFPSPRVEGHGGEIIEGVVSGTRVHCLTGRVHLYEGWSCWEVVRCVRALALLGTRTFVLTNAAGGIRGDLEVGECMLLSDHINLSGASPLVGPQHEVFGPRFPAMNEVYAPALRGSMHEANGGERLAEGVYAMLAGPSYETPAEIDMLARLGADAVGMSTVPEAIALYAMGCAVVAFSLVTNKAAGRAEQAPDHAEVVACGAAAAERTTELIARAVPLLAAARRGRGRGRAGPRARP